jgi:hypothetical protein
MRSRKKYKVYNNPTRNKEIVLLFFFFFKYIEYYTNLGCYPSFIQKILNVYF